METSLRRSFLSNLEALREKYEPGWNVAQHVNLVHQRARSFRGRGKLVVASYGEEPDTGKKLSPRVQHFEIGDNSGTQASILELGQHRFRNVYMPLSIFRSSLGAGQKGSEDDVLAVLGLVCDFDDEDAANFARRMPLKPDYVLATSPGRFQAFTFFRTPVPMPQAKELAVAMQKFTGCDPCTKDIGHVWRVAGTFNWPTRAKILQGRSQTPFRVRIEWTWDGRCTDNQQLTTALRNESARVGGLEGRPLRAQVGFSHRREAPELERSLDANLPEGERSESAYRAIRLLIENGRTDEEIEGLLMRRAVGARYAGDRVRIRDEIARARAKGVVSKAIASTARPDDGGNVSHTELPSITIAGGSLSDAATAAEQAVISAGHPVYRRGRDLVRPVVEELEATRGRRTKVAMLAVVDPVYMTDLLCRSAKFCRPTRTGMETIDPPPAVAQTILRRYGEWLFKPVVGVINTPTLRPDGSLLDKPGYDPATRLLLVDPPAMPTIPPKPTRDDALTALGVLDDLFDEFPFVDKPSRSTMLSASIATTARGALRAVPMHVARAPEPGSGKSYLFDVVAAIALGQPCPVKAAGENEQELEKRLAAAMLTGQPIIFLDNVSGELGGDALCQLIERPVVEIRILGKSEQVRIETRTTVFASGNNVQLRGDLVRRAIVCSLDARMENPETRQFKRDPVRMVLNDRGKYIAAGLIIVMAYLAAGKPNLAPQLASFEDWSDLVRSPLIWLGKRDPLETMGVARREDPDRQSAAAVFAALADTLGVGPKTAVTAAEMIKLATDNLGPKYSELHNALVTVASRGEIIDTREFGKWLARNKGRIVGGRRLEGKSDKHGHAARWWLVDA